MTNGSQSFTASHESQIYRVTPSKVKPLETTGAGDAFACGFVGMYLQKTDFAQSLKAGVCNAQSVITHCGAKEKLLSSLALKRAIKRVKVRVQKL